MEIIIFYGSQLFKCWIVLHAFLWHAGLLGVFLCIKKKPLQKIISGIPSELQKNGLNNILSFIILV